MTTFPAEECATREWPADVDRRMRHAFGRRQALGFLGLGAGALLTGCGGDGSAASAPIATSTPVPTPTPTPSPTPTQTPTPTPAGAGAALYDTDGPDDFTNLIYSPHPATTVTASQIAFDSPTAVSRDFFVPDASGNIMQLCFDDYTVSANIDIISYYAAADTGLVIGAYNLQLGGSQNLSGIEVAAHPGSAAISTTQLFNQNSGFGVFSQNVTNFPKNIDARWSMGPDGTEIGVSVEKNAEVVSKITFVLSTSRAGPTLFMQPLIRLRQGKAVIRSLRVTAKYRNARFGFIGDSLTRGAGATHPSQSFAQKVRTDYLQDVLIAGAPAATIGNWLAAVPPVLAMNPAYAFICLGTNDAIGSVPQAQRQADMTALVGKLKNAGVVPIILSCPPIGNGSVPGHNAWLAAQGWAYIDIYAPLLGTGASLNPAYDSGDGVHWNNAGHAVVYDLVKDHVVRNNLAGR